MKKCICLILLVICVILCASFVKRDIKNKDEIIPEIPVELGIVSIIPIVEVTPEPEVQLIELRYGFTDEEIYLLAQLLCGDKKISGDGEYDIDFQTEFKINYNEVSKVLSVVMNRQRDDRFPDNVKDIVLAKNQFSVFPKNLKTTPSEMALKVVQEWCEAYDNYDTGAQVVPEDHIYFTGNGYTNTTRK